MTKQEFEHLIAAYGADRARWPENTAAAGLTFVENHPKDAERIMAPALKLDVALGEFSVPLPSDLLRKRILNTASPIIANDVTPAPRRGFLHWRSAAALMLGAFVLGFGGANFMPEVETVTPPVYAEADIDEDWGSTADDMGLSDTYAWVEGESVDVSLSDL